jgi:hypothetical protein
MTSNKFTICDEIVYSNVEGCYVSDDVTTKLTYNQNIIVSRVKSLEFSAQLSTPRNFYLWIFCK